MNNQKKIWKNRVVATQTKLAFFPTQNEAEGKAEYFCSKEHLRQP